VFSAAFAVETVGRTAGGQYERGDAEVGDGRKQYQAARGKSALPFVYGRNKSHDDDVSILDDRRRRRRAGRLHGEGRIAAG
jgi:hypothetical protein